MGDTAEVTFRILLVDDEEEILFSAGTLFRTEGFPEVLTERDSRNVMGILESRAVSLVLLDLNMPFLSGYELLKKIASSHPQLPVVIMTAANELELAVECMRLGAFDYFVKPAEKSRLLATVRRALELHNLRKEVSLLTRELLSDRSRHDAAFAPIVTRSPKMRSIFSYLVAVAGTDQPVLVTGETGVGKELVARSLHVASGRKGPFVAVNIAGLDEQVFSDTLFGHRRGAFTGADQSREGLVAKASGGTLFLDEIGDLSGSAQIKLLRLLQEQEYYPLGSDTAKRCEARVVVATNRDLPRLMAENGFRKDLYYRLKSHHVTIPPLRERPEDIPLLFDHFLDQAAEKMQKPRPASPPELPGQLAAYDFPGNVRELKAMVANAVACQEKEGLSLSSFPEIAAGRGAVSEGDALSFLQGLKGKEGGEGASMPTLKDAEEALVSHALKLAKNNQGVAASYLGITRQALNKRLSRKGR